jgi:hypothetical protein
LLRKQLRPAIADYNKANRLDPSYAPAFLGRGHAYKAKGVLATNEEWNFLLEPVPIGRKEPDQAAEVIAREPAP